MILSIGWLATLRDMQVNWTQLTMSFQNQGNLVALKENPSLTKSQIPISLVSKMIDAEYFALSLNSSKEVILSVQEGELNEYEMLQL